MRLNFKGLGLRQRVETHNERLDSHLAWMKNLTEDVRQLKLDRAHYEASIERMRVDFYFGGGVRTPWREAGFCVELLLPDTAIALPVCGPASAFQVYDAIRRGRGFFQPDVVRTLVDRLPPTSSVVFLDPGIGELALQVATMLPNVRVTVVEKDDRMTEHLRSNCHRASLSSRVAFVDKIDSTHCRADLLVVSSEASVGSLQDYQVFEPSAICVAISNISPAGRKIVDTYVERFTKVEPIITKSLQPDAETATMAPDCFLIASSRK